jgi:hypothetical protein
MKRRKRHQIILLFLIITNNERILWLKKKLSFVRKQWEDSVKVLLNLNCKVLAV